MNLVKHVHGVSWLIFHHILAQLFNNVEKIVDHYRVTQRSILFYMTGQKSISFQISEVQSLHEPIPVKIYPVIAPGMIEHIFQRGT